MKINFKPNIRQIVLAFVSLALSIGIFYGVQNLVSTWCITPLPGDPVKGCSGASVSGTPTLVAQQTGVVVVATPVPTSPAVSAAPGIELPPAWDGASRVTILLLGLDTDSRVDEQGNVSADRVGPARTDTMMLLTIDPQSKTAGMLSIPRDLWVNIPGFGYGRINTAYYNGQAYKVPGGGPALAMKTVEQLIGVPVPYYAEIEFWAFMSLIEHVGKIDVYVKEKIFLDPIGPGEDEIMLKKGMHPLGGMEALAYVRNRHTADGDVDRAERQQQVIMAFRNKVLNPENFPTLIAAAPQIYADLQGGIHSNISFEDAMRLAMLMRKIPVKQIGREVIDNSMVTFANVTVNGQNQQISKPMPDKIRDLRDKVFSPGRTNNPLAKGESVALAAKERATISVLNGTYTPGIANTTAEYLTSLGFTVVNVGNANEIPPVTKIIDHRGRPYSLKYFKELFRLGGGSQIVSKFDPAASAEIEIILGEDWVQNNPMP